MISYTNAIRIGEEAKNKRGLRMTSQAKEGERGMPGRQEPKKDVAHCEKQREAVCRRRTADVRMGKPASEKAGT